MIARVLTIAGSDSGGGAGIQADIKTVTMLGGYAASAITALTVQNTLGVTDVWPVPESIIAAQIEAVLSDIGADAIKTGMLHHQGVIETVARLLTSYPDIPLILDPVMVAKGGAPLLVERAVESLKTLLIPRAKVVTPNMPEASLLTGITVTDVETMRASAKALVAFGAEWVLVKGGHAEGATVYDLLYSREEEHIYTSARLATRHTHGTGCTLASAIAYFVAAQVSVPEAVKRARLYVYEAMRQAPGIGQGHGPLQHKLDAAF